MRSSFRFPCSTLFLLISLPLTLCGAEKKPVVPGPTDKDAPREFQETDTGLKYRILRNSDQQKPTEHSKVKVHYRGWLPNPADSSQGREFDSSYERGESIEFPLKKVIAGWREGMQLVGKGGMIELEVPPTIAYGKRGAGDVIPPDATLRFIVELIDIWPGPADKDAPKEFSTTPSQLKYRILRKGKGKTPKATDEVTVNYRGWLPEPEMPSEGRTFDSSYERKEPHITFGLNGVIPGWTEGLQLIQEGGMIELEVPPQLAYGNEEAGDIPPNSTLRFLVELIKVE